MLWCAVLAAFAASPLAGNASPARTAIRPACSVASTIMPWHDTGAPAEMEARQATTASPSLPLRGSPVPAEGALSGAGARGGGAWACPPESAAS